SAARRCRGRTSSRSRGRSPPRPESRCWTSRIRLLSKRTVVFFAALACTLTAVAEAAVRSAQPLEQVNVSNDTGVQAEVAVALDPTNDQVLLAGSNSIALSALGSLARIYGSNDGGATWTSRPGPAAARLGDRKACDYGDPTVAIDRSGRQYYGFLAAACIDFSKLETGEELTIPSLEVATRAGAAGAWRSARVFPSAGTRFDDKPAIAVDTSPASPYVDRGYVAWTRIRLRGPNSFQGARGDIV